MCVCVYHEHEIEMPTIAIEEEHDGSLGFLLPFSHTTSKRPGLTALHIYIDIRGPAENLVHSHRKFAFRAKKQGIMLSFHTLRFDGVWT